LNSEEVPFFLFRFLFFTDAEEEDGETESAVVVVVEEAVQEETEEEEEEEEGDEEEDEKEEEENDKDTEEEEEEDDEEEEEEALSKLCSFPDFVSESDTIRTRRRFERLSDEGRHVTEPCFDLVLRKQALKTERERINRVK
jgi:hypothetical protein